MLLDSNDDMTTDFAMVILLHYSVIEKVVKLQ